METQSTNGANPDADFAEEFLAVRAAFETVLGRDLTGVGGHASIAGDLGADSLAVAEVCATIEENLGVLLDDDAVARARTLGEFAGAVQR